MPSHDIAIIGLGSIGMPVAQACVTSGMTVYGVDSNRTKVEAAIAKGIPRAYQSCDNILHPEQLDAIVLLVVSHSQCNSVLFGEHGLAYKLNRGTPVMISSTMSADRVQDIARALHGIGLLSLDAPVSGGPSKAIRGELSVIASGPEESFHKLKPVLDAISSHVFHIGDKIGMAATVKTIHQLMAASHIAVAAEAIALAERSGVPFDTLYQVVTHTSGNSWMFQNRMQHVVDPTSPSRSTVDIFVKDTNIVLEAARSLEISLPITELVHKLFVTASDSGLGQSDASDVIKNYAPHEPSS